MGQIHHSDWTTRLILLTHNMAAKCLRRSERRISAPVTSQLYVIGGHQELLWWTREVPSAFGWAFFHRNSKWWENSYICGSLSESLDWEHSVLIVPKHRIRKGGFSTGMWAPEHKDKCSWNQTELCVTLSPSSDTFYLIFLTTLHVKNESAKSAF